MTHATHTPGPWVATGWNNLTVNAICGDWPDANEYTIVLMTGGPSLNSGRQELEVMQANARLIAAAPDLLAALETLLEQAKATSAWDDAQSGEDQPMLDAVTAAQTAIAKTKGE